MKIGALSVPVEYELEIIQVRHEYNVMEKKFDSYYMAELHYWIEPWDVDEKILVTGDLDHV